jgi:hypothetical protein
LRLKTQERGEVTPYGGLTLAHELAMRLGIDRDLNASLELLKLHLPYFESDHVLTHVYNLFVGGRCIEDIGHIQHSDALKNLLGACRIPDPTTAGDFLRRFGSRDLDGFQSVIDDARERVWRQLPKTRRRKATIDLDSTIKEVYGECKQGVDFSYTGKWSYHPLLVTLSETNEPLRTINRPGNSGSADGAAEALRTVLPRVARRFGEVFVRGDSQFYTRPIIAACREHGANFALMMSAVPVLLEKAESLRKTAWKPFSTEQQPEPDRRAKPKKSRRKRTRHRRRIVRRRGYKNLSTVREWVAEFDYRLPRESRWAHLGLAGQRYRVVVRRQRVEVSKGQEHLYDEYRYSFYITNIPPRRMTAAEIIRFAYGRCDQENIIEQLKNGIAALRMPTGELLDEPCVPHDGPTGLVPSLLAVAPGPSERDDSLGVELVPARLRVRGRQDHAERPTSGRVPRTVTSLRRPSPDRLGASSLLRVPLIRRKGGERDARWGARSLCAG